MKEDQLSKDEQAVLNLIPRGIERTVTATDIANITGMSRRRIASIIQVLVVNHSYPIGSLRKMDHHGYFIAETREQLNMAMMPLVGQVREMQRRLNVMSNIDLDNDTQASGQKKSAHN